MSTYEQGRQPCEAFRPRREGNPYGVWSNVHECFGPYRPDHRTSEERAMDSAWGQLRAPENRCSGSVSFCVACSTDHHSAGWDSCGQPVLEAQP